jgi:hypothetical protein
MAENVAKLSDANKNILPEFQKFLIERKLAPKKNEGDKNKGSWLNRVCP